VRHRRRLQLAAEVATGSDVARPVCDAIADTGPELATALPQNNTDQRLAAQKARLDPANVYARINAKAGQATPTAPKQQPEAGHVTLDL
jgi:hypothetical protein